MRRHFAGPVRQRPDHRQLPSGLRHRHRRALPLGEHNDRFAREVTGQKGPRHHQQQAEVCDPQSDAPSPQTCEHRGKQVDRQRRARTHHAGQRNAERPAEQPRVEEPLRRAMEPHRRVGLRERPPDREHGEPEQPRHRDAGIGKAAQRCPGPASEIRHDALQYPSRWSSSTNRGRCASKEDVP